MTGRKWLIANGKQLSCSIYDSIRYHAQEIDYMHLCCSFIHMLKQILFDRKYFLQEGRNIGCDDN